MNDQTQGDFLQSLAPMQASLRLHCYRMLGSSHDSDDMVQETFLRAWRAKDTLTEPSMLRPWLYRIATNACLDELSRRPKRALASDLFPPAVEGTHVSAPAIEENLWLEPMPSHWLQSVPAVDPAAKYTLKESVALAFVAMLHLLSPAQRATLLLRDVVGLSASETADALGMSISAANSALFRARAMVEEKVGARESADFVATRADVDEALLARYVRAFEEANFDQLLALFHDDVRTAMPPSPTWLLGRTANEKFYRPMFAASIPGNLRVVRVGANGQPGFAFYRAVPGEAVLKLRAVQVVTIRDGALIGIDHFIMPLVFPAFAIPLEISRSA